MLRIILITLAVIVVFWIVRRILTLRARRKGWLEFQVAAEALTPEQLPEIAGEFRRFVQNELNTDLAALGFAEQAQFLYKHIEELQKPGTEYFTNITLEKHPEQTPWLGLAAYLGELVRAQHPNAVWRKDEGGLNVVVIEYPEDPPYQSYSPFANIYQVAYQHNLNEGPVTLYYGFRYILRAEAVNRQRGIKYTPEEMAAFEKQLEERFGKVRVVWHEIVSPDVHLDIFVVDPPDGSAVYLFTCGMGAYLMSVPEEQRAAGVAERLELMVTLPNDWPLGFMEQKKDANYWPTRMLKDIARYPVENATLIGAGHTVQMPSPYAKTKFETILLLPPPGRTPEELRFRLSPEVEVGLLQLIPLYPAERDYVMEHREEAPALFGEATRVINPARPSVLPPEAKERK